MHTHGFIAHLLQTYGYWGLFGALALEYFFIPVPGETTLVSSGVLWQTGQYHLLLIWLITATTLGTFTGSMIGYGIGRGLGRPFLERYGKYVRITPARIDKADRLFAKYTVPTLFISRYIAFVRIFVPYIAGVNRVRLTVYIPVMLISSAAWTTTFILAGTVIERLVSEVIHHWQRDLIPAVLVTAALVVGYWYLHRWMKHKINLSDDPPQNPGQSKEPPTS